MFTHGNLDRPFWLLVWCPGTGYLRRWILADGVWGPETLFHFFCSEDGMERRRRLVEEKGWHIIASGRFTARDIFRAQIEGWEVLDPLKEDRERLPRPRVH